MPNDHNLASIDNEHGAESLIYRRSDDPKIEDLQKAVEENTAGIKKVSERLETMEKVWNDVSVVGRFGRGLTKVILALTAFGASLAALWHYFSDGNG
jgi:hypothetical protein